MSDLENYGCFCHENLENFKSSDTINGPVDEIDQICQNFGHSLGCLQTDFSENCKADRPVGFLVNEDGKISCGTFLIEWNKLHL